MNWARASGSTMDRRDRVAFCVAMASNSHASSGVRRGPGDRLPPHRMPLRAEPARRGQVKRAICSLEPTHNAVAGGARAQHCTFYTPDGNTPTLLTESGLNTSGLV